MKRALRWCLEDSEHSFTRAAISYCRCHDQYFYYYLLLRKARGLQQDRGIDDPAGSGPENWQKFSKLGSSRLWASHLFNTLWLSCSIYKMAVGNDALGDHEE